MSKKNLAPDSLKPKRGNQLFYLLVLEVILIYILFPYQQEDTPEKDEPVPELNVVVLNGCRVPDIAKEVAEELLNMGIDVADHDNIPNTNCLHQETKIVVRYYSEGQQQRLDYLQKVTGIEKVVLLEKENSLAEFELILGKDYIKYFKEK